MRYLAHGFMQRYARRHPDSPTPAAHAALLAGGLCCSSTLWAWAAWAGMPVFTDNEKLSVMIIVSALAGRAAGPTRVCHVRGLMLAHSVR